MRIWVAGLGAAAMVAGAGSAVLAAPPSVFQATGVFHTVTESGAQNVGITIDFKSGHVRIETHSKEAGTSIIVVDKGKDDVAMIDPSQKVVVHMKPSMLKAANGANAGDLSSYQGMLDPAHFRAFIMEHGGHKVGPGPGILGHRTTVYEANRKGDEMKVWLADDLSLPLKIEGRSAAGGSFDVDITSLNLHPAFGAQVFDATPPGYTDIRAQANK